MSVKGRLAVISVVAALVTLSVCAAPSAMPKSGASAHSLRFRVVKRTARFDVVRGHHRRFAVRHGVHVVVINDAERYRVVRRTHKFVVLKPISTAPWPIPAPTPAVALEEGISFTAHSAGAYANPDAHHALDELRATGATWVMILATAYQANIASTNIARTELTPSDASLKNIIAYAHRIGLKVMLKPQIDLSNDAVHDRASIGSTFATADWAPWFASYTSFIIHYAKLGAAAHCEQFSVGCVLNATVAHEAAWRQIIADVRSVYHGNLTYAANLYTDSPTNPHNVQFWDALDLIGLNMYPTLSDQPVPTVADLVASWGSVYARLAELHARWKKPVVFTEIGIRSIAGAARTPWDWQNRGAADPDVQANWYQAALQTFAANRSFMAGMFWWEWDPWASVGGTGNTGYTPHGKPAEIILTDWYTNRIR